MNIESQIGAALQTKQRVIVCIDGPAGAGKSTFAKALTVQFPANVVHMDDLYEGWNQPLNSDLTIRVQRVIASHLNGDEIKYQRFDWKLNEFDGWQTLPSKPLLILEGVGSGQREIRELCDLLIFIDIDAETGRERVIARDGTDVASHLFEWQVHESAHFARNQTRAAADFVISGYPSKSIPNEQ